MRPWIAMLLLAGVGAGMAAEARAPSTAGHPVTAVVRADSQFAFTLHTRWGQVLIGRFPNAEGEVIVLPDGRREVRLKLDAETVEIVDHPRYTRLTRGPRFFDVTRNPDVQFLSEPYTSDLLHAGGSLYGQLRLHGVQRRERFVLQPAGCAHPGRDCDIVARGVISRADYDLDGWRMALRDDVRFDLRVRLRDLPADTATP
jgi:polyisoprenoid-binding protein YceI